MAQQTWGRNVVKSVSDLNKEDIDEEKDKFENKVKKISEKI